MIQGGIGILINLYRAGQVRHAREPGPGRGRSRVNTGKREQNSDLAGHAGGNDGVRNWFRDLRAGPRSLRWSGVGGILIRTGVPPSQVPPMTTVPEQGQLVDVRQRRYVVA